jgi:hypothetical protein
MDERGTELEEAEEKSRSLETAAHNIANTEDLYNEKTGKKQTAGIVQCIALRVRA